MKSSFYFDHDYNARNDQRILELRAEYGWAGYGLFFALLESLCESKGYIKREALAGLSLGLSYPKDTLIQFLEFCIKIELFSECENGIYSTRIIEHLEFRQKLSEAGSRGGRGNKAPLKPPFSQPKATPEAGKERKEEESKEDIVLPNSKRSVKNIPASIEFYKVGEAQSQSGEYKILCRFICGENKTDKPLKKILSLPEQLTEDQFNILKDKAHQKDKKVIQMILDCEGKDSYTKGRENLYLILNSWLNHTK